MKKLTWFLAGTLIMALAAPALAGHGGKCSHDAQACLDMMASKKDKGYMGVELDKSEDGALVITKVLEGTPAAEAGFKAGDVLVARNGIKLSDEEALKKDKASYKVGAKVKYLIKRGGAEREIAVTLAKMPEDVFARMVGSHMIESHMAVATTAEAKGHKHDHGK